MVRLSLVGLAVSGSALHSDVTTYQYDELGRLIQVRDTANRSQSFVYDAAGNRREMRAQAANGGVNRAPVAVGDSYSVRINVQSIVYPLVNDSDPDGDSISIVSVTQPWNASVTINSGNSLSIVGTVAPGGGSSTAAFNYTVSDGRGGVATGNVTITVRGGRDDLR
jgi:YD repeat-containing protein